MLISWEEHKIYERAKEIGELVGIYIKPSWNPLLIKHIMDREKLIKNLDKGNEK